MDPVQVKVDQYSNNANPIAAQPVAAPYTTTNYGVNPGYSGTTATPVQHQPMVVQSVPTGYASGSPNPLFVQNGRQYPQGRWGDSICDWPTNLFPSCYCVCCFCCGMYLAAQSKSYELVTFFFFHRDHNIISPIIVAQKVGYSSFRSVILAFVGFCIFGFILELIIGGVWIVWIPMIFAFCFALGLRLFIVSKEGINECGANPCLGECCVGFWCWYCSVAQSKSFVFRNVISV